MLQYFRKMSLSIEDLQSVYSMTYGVRSQWFKVLLELGVPHDTIVSIRLIHRNNPDECYLEGLTEWLQFGRRSWRDLEEAFSSPAVGRYDMAEMIRDHIRSIGSASSVRQTGKFLGWLVCPWSPHILSI